MKDKNYVNDEVNFAELVIRETVLETLQYNIFLVPLFFPVNVAFYPSSFLAIPYSSLLSFVLHSLPLSPLHSPRLPPCIPPPPYYPSGCLLSSVSLSPHPRSSAVSPSLWKKGHSGRNLPVFMSYRRPVDPSVD